MSQAASFQIHITSKSNPLSIKDYQVIKYTQVIETLTSRTTLSFEGQCLEVNRINERELFTETDMRRYRIYLRRKKNLSRWIKVPYIKGTCQN
jgi:hypothetical protein